MSKSQEKVRLLDMGNAEAARIILSDVTRYGGPDGVMVTWARMIIAKGANGGTKGTHNERQGLRS
jgi:hypothetical protein